MSRYEELLNFLSVESGLAREQCVPDADLETDLGITGMEGYDLIKAYGRQFSVRIDHLHLNEYFQDEPSWFHQVRVVKPLRIRDLIDGIESGTLKPMG